MRVALGVDQLRINADLVTRTANTPFEDIAHAELTADPFRVDPLASIGECGIARNHEHPRKPRQFGREILGDPVGEIPLLPVVAEVHEGQNYNRQTWRSDGRR